MTNLSEVADIPARLQKHGVDQQGASLCLVPLQTVGNLLALLLALLLVWLGGRLELVEVAGTLLLKLLHDPLQLFLLLVEFLLVAGNCLLQAGQRCRRVLHLGKGRNISLRSAVVLDGHVHGQLVSSLQRQLCVAQITFGTMGGVVALNTQKVDLMNQRLADAIDKHRVFHQIVEGRLRHARQQFFLVDGFCQLFSKAAQTSQRAARVDKQYGFGQAREVYQQLVAGAEEFEVG
ncbi:hypothetical protein D9M68_579410 [compost metagenome]